MLKILENAKKIGFQESLNFLETLKKYRSQ